MSGSGDYISREALKELFDGIYDCADLVFEPDDQICSKQHSSCGTCRWLETKRAIQKSVMSVPAADVRPVRRGKWMPIIEGNEYGETYQIGCYCSECEEVLQHEPYFCPNCGADMREES